MSAVIYEIKDGIATITLNRPKVFNSINGAIARQLQEYLDSCKNEKKVRAVVITGTGKAFCAGQDLKEATDPDQMPGFEYLLEQHYRPIVERIIHLDKPIIAAVNGVAAGAGANIALCCDIVIAKESASFIQAFSAIGLIPDSAGTYFLPRLIGRAKAMAYAMLGDKIKAPQAAIEGMIYRAVPDEEFDAAVSILSKKLSNMPTKALGFIKKTINESYNNSTTEQLNLETKLQIAAANTKDYKEGVTAFLEKRKPLFKGE